MSAFGGKADIAVNFALSRPLKTPDGFCFVVILPDGFAATASRRLGPSRNWITKGEDVLHPRLSSWAVSRNRHHMSILQYSDSPVCSVMNTPRITVNVAKLPAPASRRRHFLMVRPPKIVSPGETIQIVPKPTSHYELDCCGSWAQIKMPRPHERLGQLGSDRC